MISSRSSLITLLVTAGGERRGTEKEYDARKNVDSRYFPFFPKRDGRLPVEARRQPRYRGRGRVKLTPRRGILNDHLARETGKKSLHANARWRKQLCGVRARARGSITLPVTVIKSTNRVVCHSREIHLSDITLGYTRWI